MSFLHDAVLPGTARFYNGGSNDAVKSPARRLRKSQSHGGFLSPLVHLVRNPVSSLGDALGGLREEYARTTAETAEVEDRKKILYFRMKEVSCEHGM